MAKEYRTISEVAGPLMMVRGVTDVSYNELGEIELANGEKRRCRVLEIDGTNALVWPCGGELRFRFQAVFQQQRRDRCLFQVRQADGASGK